MPDSMGDSIRNPKFRPAFIIAISILVLILMVSLFGLTSLNLPFISPSGSAATFLLFALSTLIFLGLVIFGFILARSLIKLHIERRAKILGSKFKTKLVYGALGLSVLPVFFLFLFSYSLLNRTLDKWFSRPFERLSSDAHQVVDEIRGLAQANAANDAEFLALQMSSKSSSLAGILASLAPDSSIAMPRNTSYFAVLTEDGKPLLESSLEPDWPRLPSDLLQSKTSDGLPAAARLMDLNGASFVYGWARLMTAEQNQAFLVIGKKLPANVSAAAARLNAESVLYIELSSERKTLRQAYLSMLLLLTVMILFISTWFALFLSRQVTIPIQALAEATHEVSRGNLEHRVHARAADELGILVGSFNEMTEQLSAGRTALEQSRSHLEQANLELDQRRRFTETILESIPTGVISVSGAGAILGANSAARRLFGQDITTSRHMSEIFTKEDQVELNYLMKRAARLGQSMRNLEVRLQGRSLNLAVTVSALPGIPPGLSGGDLESSWYVIVMEDLSELLQAQKTTAWGEVAQRVAHEIKNPLTPIALSAERIHLWLERYKDTAQDSPVLRQVIGESCSLIQQEVGQLKQLVDEFSQFSRFPKAQPVSSNLNQIAENAISAFNGRLSGIHIERRLAENLPPVQVDADLFRRVFVNLIDNAAEAMEQSLVKEIVFATRVDPQREMVEAEVADTGCGVSSDDKEKLFLPFFSTKGRGTGLGLAIVNRIVMEHKGTIRVEENRPIGTRFIIELPVTQNS
ncbi:MAG: hypothetical protein A3F68_13315 [Acidobacteria bacterium RIFCSPLOWO2_12_FULL_54_10]|nr:MAG: hypothetical protein A3F68_13315 [Acidobacteria bacterium RIFCSPLOWO2_12_FULL_54_10]